MCWLNDGKSGEKSNDGKSGEKSLKHGIGALGRLHAEIWVASAGWLRGLAADRDGRDDR